MAAVFVLKPYYSTQNKIYNKNCSSSTTTTTTTTSTQKQQQQPKFETTGNNI